MSRINSTHWKEQMSIADVSPKQIACTMQSNCFLSQINCSSRQHDYRQCSLSVRLIDMQVFVSSLLYGYSWMVVRDTIPWARRRKTTFPVLITLSVPQKQIWSEKKCDALWKKCFFLETLLQQQHLQYWNKRSLYKRINVTDQKNFSSIYIVICNR